MAYDANLDATFTPSVGGTPTSAYLAKVNANFAYLGQAWTSFTPSWTATVNPAIGNGTLTGAYLQLGKTLHVRYYMLAGSTTTFGTDEWVFALPNSLTSAAGAKQAIGGFIEDSSTAVRYPVAGIINASATTILRTAPSGTQGIKSTVPFTWATGDYLILEGTIEVA